MLDYSIGALEYRTGQGSIGDFDWSGALGQVSKTASDVLIAREQRKALASGARAEELLAMRGGGGGPTSTVAAGSSMLPLLAIGAVLLLLRR